MKKLQIFGLCLAVIILIGMFLFPTSEAFPLPARNTLGLLIALIILLVTEVFPLGATCLVAISLMVLFQCVPDAASALSGYTNPVLFFVVASFGISEALTIVPLSKRMLIFLMRVFGQNTKRLLFAIMLCVALLSSVISNVAAAVVFIPIILKFAEVYEKEDDRKRTLRCYMIALPIASMVGGMMTPAGSSINMLAIGLLSKNAGINIPFVEWMLFGIPLACGALPIAWVICTRVFPPTPLSEIKIKQFLDSIIMEKRLSKKEVYVLIILVAMLTLWILSSWYPVFNVTVVALVGLLLFFIPGFEILSWSGFKQCVSWEAFFLMGTMISMGNAITSSGLSSWIAEVIFPSSFNFPVIIVVGFIALLTFLLLIPIPVAPALVAMLIPPLVSFAVNLSLNPYMLVITVALCAGNCYFLPLDTVPLMTFSTGAYKMFDMPRVSGPLQICVVLLATIWISVASLLLGI